MANQSAAKGDGFQFADETDETQIPRHFIPSVERL